MRNPLISSVILVVTYSCDGASGPANRLARAFLSVLWRIGRVGGNHVQLGKAEATCRYNGFPAPLGAKLIVWASMAVWLMLLFAPLDLGMYWLAALFALGPTYTIWRWPEMISIDELNKSFSVCLTKIFVDLTK